MWRIMGNITAQTINSPGRFAWLLGPSEILTNEKPNCDEFRAACKFALNCWQVLPAIGPKLLDWGTADFSDDPMAQRIRDRIVSLSTLARVQLKLCQRVTAALEQEGIPYVLLKGSAIRLTAYERPELRCGKDIDLGIPCRFLAYAEQIAHDYGFLPAQWHESQKRFYRADPLVRAKVEAQHYELGFLARRQIIRDLSPEEEIAIRRDLPSQYIWNLSAKDELACYVTIDIHHGLSLDITVDPLVKTAHTWNDRPYPVKLPVFEWLLFHLIYKIYWEGVHNYNKGGYQYADLTRQILKSDKTTLDRLWGLLSNYNLEAAGYYVLRRLATDLRMSPDPEQVSFLRQTAVPPEGRDPVLLNDLGDMWPKLWGHR